MIRSFQFLGAALLAATAYFLWQRQLDTAFVTGVLGACAVFLSLRVGFKTRSTEREAEKKRLREQANDEE